MSHEISTLDPRWNLARWAALALLGLLLVAAPSSVTAQDGTGIAVVDAGRVFQESEYGLSLLERLKVLRETKQTEGLTKQEEAKALQDRISQGSLALSPEKLEELQKDLEERMIDLQRFETDAKREIDQASSQAMGSFNQLIMPVIDSVGREQGFTLIFNKFEAGLLFASEQVDITDAVIQRFDTENPAASAEAADSQPSE